MRSILITYFPEKFVKCQKSLLMVGGKAFVSYLADIFEKLNILNKQLQAINKTLVDAKAKIFGFITFIELCQKYM